MSPPRHDRRGFDADVRLRLLEEDLNERERVEVQLRRDIQALERKFNRILVAVIVLLLSALINLAIGILLAAVKT